ncbi:glycosyltransferase family 39 protein [Cohnella sp. REN36]|uniref:glycosyltransferase family 39 protein n=1 Tax=Cohnella sp. REN36 TaxID=2887347 RepID=UPI001D140555|nr:glycosyltransferase family 39 protein [Cohnella sp. REN36]MCC3373018.1 glycosyltransferase family 39 protein [Cohnella sp. REN36]
MKVNRKIMITSLLVIGFIIRLSVMNWGGTLAGDEIGYDKMVKQLLYEGIYGYTPYSYSHVSNAFTTPGYPLFIAVFYWIFGFNEAYIPIEPIRIFQAILSVGSALILYNISLPIIKNKHISLFVMILMLFHPSFIYSSSFLLTETLYTFVFLLFILFLTLSYNGSRFNHLFHFISGFAFAICVLIRPAIFPFILVYCLYLLILNKNELRKTLRTLLLLLLGFGIVMSPWIVRNYVSLGKFVMLAEQGGNPLLWGTYPFNAAPKIDVSQDPAMMKTMAMERIKSGFTKQPLLYASWYTWGKSWYLIKAIWPGNNQVANEPTIRLLHYIVVFMGFLGMIVMSIQYKTKEICTPALLGFISFVAYLPFAPTPRYFFSAIPICMLGMGYLFVFIYHAVISKSTIKNFIK